MKMLGRKSVAGSILMLLSASASADTEKFSLADVSCVGRKCIATIQSTSGESAYVQGRGFYMTRKIALRKTAELNATRLTTAN